MKFERSKTNRGFAIIHFNDDYDEKCSLQESSAVEPHIWLGIADPRPIIMCSDASKLGVERKANNGWQDYEIPKEVFCAYKNALKQKAIYKVGYEVIGIWAVWKSIRSYKMDNQLKPCPFCGKKAHVMMFHGTYIVGCITPMCYGDINHLTLRFFDKNHAIETWNRRAEDGKKDY